MHGIYSGCALIKKRLAVRLYLRGKILRLTQRKRTFEKQCDELNS